VKDTAVLIVKEMVFVNTRKDAQHVNTAILIINVSMDYLNQIVTNVNTQCAHIISENHYASNATELVYAYIE